MTKDGFDRYLSVLSQKEEVDVSDGVAEADWSRGRMSLFWMEDLGYPWLDLGNEYGAMRDAAITEFEKRLSFNVLSGMKISEL